MDESHEKEQVEPVPITVAELSRILRDESWEGRWNPDDYSNLAPLANHTAEMLILAFARRGAVLTAVYSGSEAQDG